MHIVELHEVRSINTLLSDLSSMGFGIESLLPQDRTGTDQPRYSFRRGESTIGLADLRGLLAAVRAAGEKGLTITRFKGLGELNADAPMRDTTSSTHDRTLLPSDDGRRQRRRRPLPRSDGRQSRTPPRVHREALAGSAEFDGGVVATSLPLANRSTHPKMCEDRMESPRLVLEHIGPIKRADLEFGDLTVLVGPQASGKSILLQMLNFVVDSDAVIGALKDYGTNLQARVSEPDRIAEFFEGLFWRGDEPGMEQSPERRAFRWKASKSR